MAPGRRAAKSRESPVRVADSWRRPLALGSSLEMPVSTPVSWRRLDAEPGSQESGQLALDKHQGSAFQTGMGWQQQGLQVRTSVPLVLSAQLASVTFHHCQLPFGSLPCVFL